MSVANSPRIGYVVNEFPQAGDERLIGELLELERCGIELSVFALRRPDSCRPPVKAARLRAKVAYLPTRAPVRERGAWVASQLRDIEHLHAYSAQQSADITREISELTGMPFSFSVESTDLGPGGVRRRDLRTRADLAQFIVTRSAASIGVVADVCDEDVFRKCHCLYHGLDLAELPFTSELRPADAVLAVAGPDGHDGVSDILVALARVRGRGATTRVTLIADEHRHAAVLRQLEHSGLTESVQVTSMPSEDGLFTLMRRHALLVAPWRKTSEPADIPEIILQAMAVGLPVIASDLPGISEAIEDGWTGRLIPAGDDTWLAGAIETLLQNARLRHRMARHARQLVERDFSLSRNGSVLAHIFSHAASDRRWMSNFSRTLGTTGTRHPKGTGLSIR
jgi:colanic acid/amylovoran biosynthesis glycosyltransferase